MSGRRPRLAPSRSATQLMRDWLQERDMLASAVRAVLSDDQGAMRIWSEDHSMKTDMDPIRKTDVLEHAVKILDSNVAKGG